MGRRRRGPGSSLDLLLDTICNTFGGVVFIAILVIVLLQMTGSTQLDVPPGEAEQKELIALEARRDDVESRLKSLRETAAQQEAILTQITDPNDEALAADLKELRTRRDDLAADRRKSLGEISQAQISTNEAAAKLASLENDLRDVPMKVAALEVALKEELAKRTETARLPVQRDTEKREIPALFKAGRVHFVYIVNSDGSVIFNSSECRSGNAPGAQEVESLPGTGVAIDESDQSRADLDARLRSLDSETDYLAVFVWPDSFAQFRLLKDQLVSGGFEYRLVPMTVDGKVVRNAPKTSKPKVQ